MEATFGGKKKRLKPRRKPAKKAPARPSPSPREPQEHKRTFEGQQRREIRGKERRLRYELNATYTIRDIANVPPDMPIEPLALDKINWERRKACRKDPLLDLKTYLPKVFYLEWADYQQELIKSIESCMEDGGKKAFGCPRGGGKTAIVRGMIMRATKYGMRRFAFFIGSREDKAKQTLDFIRGFWYRSPELRQDFPEIAYPVYRIEGRGGVGSLGQLYKGERTYINWSTNEVQYPCMLFDEEDVAGYLQHEPKNVLWLPDHGVDIPKFMIRSAGCIIRVAGVDGSIRGEAELHPVLLSQPRPDFVLLDDVQKEQKADSPKSCQDLENLIESAIDYLRAPDIGQAMLMPCTVIREGDVSDRFLSPEIKPDWVGERHAVISKYPKGINDDTILEEVDGERNEQGVLWLEYQKIRDESLRVHGDFRLANQYYLENREQMSAGFEISWKQRFLQDSKDPNRNEVDALQAAMNWRFKDLPSFMSEAQNRPRPKVGLHTILIRSGELMEKISNIPENQLAANWQDMVAFIDVQEEILFYAIFAFDYDFSGQIVAYGTWPHVSSLFFSKNQTLGWALLSREFWKAYPEQRKQAKALQTRNTKGRAPFEGKIYHALDCCTTEILGFDFPVHDQDQAVRQVRGIAIDTQWGKSSDTVKRFIREKRDPRLIAYRGHPFLPSHKQLEEYEARPGWLFEHQQHPHVKEPTWSIRPHPDGSRYILADVNRLKSFLMNRLAAPMGTPGCITLYADRPEHHRMFAEHVCSSEYPEPIQARGMVKDCWKTRPNTRSENDYLDCTAGCMCLASICGASIKTGHEPPVTRRPSFRDIYKRKKGAA